MARHQRHQHERGAAAIETALSLIILTFVAMAGVYFTDAILVRQRLTAATSRAARVCAVSARQDNMQACVTQQITAALTNPAGEGIIVRCPPQIETEEVILRANLSMVTTRVRCQYNNTLAALLQANEAGDGNGLTLRAQATMPVAR